MYYWNATQRTAAALGLIGLLWLIAFWAMA